MSFQDSIDTITPAQFEKLPEVFADLVNCDRLLATERTKDVPSLTEYRRLTAMRAEARAGAHAQYGHAAKNNGSGPVTA